MKMGVELQAFDVGRFRRPGRGTRAVRGVWGALGTEVAGAVGTPARTGPVPGAGTGPSAMRGGFTYGAAVLTSRDLIRVRDRARPRLAPRSSASRGSVAGTPAARGTGRDSDPDVGRGLAGRIRRRTERDVTPEVPLERIRAADERLFELALGNGRDRLELGTLLNEFARKSWHHELGYSSMEAYALQNCGRSARWVSETRTLARRLSELPALRRALLDGRVGWSMAELVARHASADTDVALAALASRSTVRQLRSLFAAVSARAESGQVPMPGLNAGQTSADSEVVAAGQMSAGHDSAGLASSEADAEAGAGGQMSAGPKSGQGQTSAGGRVEPAPSDIVGQMSARLLAAAEADVECTLRVTLSTKDALLFAWTHRFFEHLVGSRQGSDFFLEAMLAEAAEELTPTDIDRLIPMEKAAAGLDAKRLAWLEQLAAWREESERLCEHNVPARQALEIPENVSEGDLHERIVALNKKMIAREVALGEAAQSFQRMDGWLRLGYASLAQYARERLGMSASSLKSKLTLARRLHAPVKEALRSGRVGHAAAMAISTVATAGSAEAWVDRARRRTVKHLREDVNAARMLNQSTPPTDEQVRQVQAIETRILQGDHSAMEEPKGQTSAGAPIRLSLRVSRDISRALRCFERVMGPRLDGSTMRFLCNKFWDAWKHMCNRREKWSHIYARDRYECTSPVCSRHDMTPHHLLFRSKGGTDDPFNMAGDCLWCHLEGIHGGRITVTGTADDMTWTIGRKHPLRVEGRELITPDSS